MKLSDNPEALKRFRKTPWKFQETFHTPLEDLGNFVTTILTGCAELEAASMTIESAVFEPKHLISVLKNHALEPSYARGATLTTDNREEVPRLLTAALSDWMDFVFVPTPKPFVIYADHHKFITLYAHTRSNLNHVTQPLVQNGFSMVQNYRRRF